MNKSKTRLSRPALFTKQAARTDNKIQTVGFGGSNFPQVSGNDMECPLVSSLKTEFLDSREAAAYLRLSVGALRNMTSNGQVPYYKLVGRNRYLKSDLQGLLLRNRRGGV